MFGNALRITMVVEEMIAASIFDISTRFAVSFALLTTGTMVFHGLMT